LPHIAAVNESMRVLHLTDDPGHAGGVSAYLADLLPMQASRGIEAHVYSASSKPGPFQAWFSRWASVSHYRSVKQLIARDRPNLIHAHNLAWRLSPLPLRAAREHALPVALTVHDFHWVCPRKWMRRSITDRCSDGFGVRCLISNCLSDRSGWLNQPYQNLRWLKVALHRAMLRAWVDVFVCPSQELVRLIRSNLRGKNVVHLPNFVPDFDFVDPPAPHSQLLFAGRLNKEKGVEHLIAALPSILESCPETSLTIAGDGPCRTDLEDLTAKLGVSEHVRFLGTVPRPALGALYRNCTACVLPSLWMENCPIAGLEALAAGRPLLGSRIGGIPEIIEDGANGLLFNPGDHLDLARQAVRLLSDPILIDELGRNARATFESRYSAGLHLDRLTMIYGSVLARRPD
jgi:glycosyltransferase involved in cell wall biosynthesis